MELARGRGGQEAEQIVVESRQHDLGFGIAESGVELEHGRAVFGEYQADENEPAVGDRILAEDIENGVDDGLHGPVDQIRRESVER